MFDSLSSLVHHVKLSLSPEYARQEKEKDVVSQITMLIQDIGNTDKVKVLLNELSGGALETITTNLIESTYFEYNDLGVNIDPSKASIAVAEVMKMARAHAELSGHGDRASWAAKRIMFAHKWAVMGKVLTSSLESEIRAIAAQISWAKNGYMEREVQSYLTQKGLFQ